MINAEALANFLLARLAEEETRAKDWPYKNGVRKTETSEWITLWSPARAQADIDAKRGVIKVLMDLSHDEGDYDESFSPCPAARGGDVCACETEGEVLDALKHLAAVYADHPDFLKEWTL